MRPLQYNIYKGVSGKFGAVQFNLQKPHFYKDRDKDFTGARALDSNGRLQDGWKQREGAVFIEATSPNGKNQYNWEEKITFACSITDMGKIIQSLTFGTDLDLLHDPSAGTDQRGAVQKHVKLYSKDGPMKSGALLTVTQSEGSNKSEHRIPLSGDECVVLRELLLKACSQSLAW